MDINGNSNSYYFAQPGQHWEMASSAHSQGVPNWFQSMVYEPSNGGEPLLPGVSSHNIYVDANQSLWPAPSEVTPQSTVNPDNPDPTLYETDLSAQGSSFYGYDNSHQNIAYAVAPELGAQQQPQPYFMPAHPIPAQSSLEGPYQPIPAQSSLEGPYQPPVYLPQPMGQFQSQPLAYAAPQQPFDGISELLPSGFINIMLPIYPGNENVLTNFLAMSAPPAEPASSRQPNPGTPSHYRRRSKGSPSQNRELGGKLNNVGWDQPKWNVREEPSSLIGAHGYRRSDMGYFRFCKLCINNGEPLFSCYSHSLRDEKGNISCPILRANVCRVCGATGDKAHTLKYCPLRRQRQEERRARAEVVEDSKTEQ